MRKIIQLKFGQPIPDDARPIGLIITPGDPVFYYDVPVEEEKKDEPAKRRKVQTAGREGS